MHRPDLMRGLTCFSVLFALVVALGFSQAQAATLQGRPGSSTPGNPPTTTPSKKPAAIAKTAISGPSFNNEGISADGASTSANYDGNGYNYSSNALSAAGFGSGAVVTVNGISYQWPTVTNGTADNWVTAGQVISVGTANRLWFLGSSTNGPSSGTATITYTDNSTQTFTLTFSDWTLNAGTASVDPSNQIAATMSYRNTSTGAKNSVNTYVFATSVALTSGKFTKSVTLPNGANTGHLHVFALSGESDWTTYDHDLASSGYNAAETTLSTANFANMSTTPKWTAHGAGGISDQALVVGNTVYWGSWDGNLHATNVSGANAGKDSWTTNLGTTTDSNCNPVSVGVASTPAYGSISGTPTIYVGGGGNDSVGGNNVYLYAINATTGSVTWKTVIGSAPDDFAWSSPVIYNGSVYYGVASYGDCPLTRGRMIKLDATTGAIQTTFYTVPGNNCTAGGIWGSPSIDTSTGMLYVPTGTPSSNCAGQTGDYSMSLLELKTSDLSYVASWRVPANQTAPDGDFGSVPTLFSGTISGTNTPLVGVANKNGIFYAFKRSNIAAGPVWQTRIANSGSCPQCGDGAISPAVWDGATLYVGGGNITINGTACKGSVDALDPSTGSDKWQHCLNSGPVLGSLAAVPGVVVATQGSWVNALNMSTGATIFRYNDLGTNSTYYSPVTVANGHLYAPNLDGNFSVFGL